MSSSTEDHHGRESDASASADSNVVVDGNRVALEGEFDLSCLALLVAATVELVGPCVIDLHETRFIDASCIGALVQLRNRLRQGNGDLVFVGASGPVRRVLGICGLLAER